MDLHELLDLLHGSFYKYSTLAHLAHCSHSSNIDGEYGMLFVLEGVERNVEYFVTKYHK